MASEQMQQALEVTPQVPGTPAPGVSVTMPGTASRPRPTAGNVSLGATDVARAAGRARGCRSVCRSLVPLPVIAMKVVKATEDETVSIEDVARLVATDPVLAGKVLRLASSAYYTRSMRPGTIQEAVVLLGAQRFADSRRRGPVERYLGHRRHQSE